MGLRGDHLVTLLIRTEQTGSLSRLSGYNENLTATCIRTTLLFLLIPAWTVGSCLLIVGSFNSARAESPPLFQTSFTSPLDEKKWQGDLSYFKSITSHESGLLQLDAPPELGSAYLATRNPYRALHWEWYIRQAFASSNNNRAFIYLNADSGELDDQPGGFAIRTGENGTPKHFRLMHFNRQGTASELLKSDVQIEADKGYRIRVLLSPDGEIHLYLAEGRFNTPMLQSEKISLPELGETLDGYFGLQTRYTATRSDQFFFSDIWIADELPEPGISNVTNSPLSDIQLSDNSPWQNLTNGTVLTVTFNVPPDSTDLSTELFQLNRDLQPDGIYCRHPQVCLLLFGESLSSGKYRLMTDSYYTMYGQQAAPEETIVLVPGNAEAGDIIINEFMYRPPAGLASYVELLNISDKLINLRNWRLQRRALTTEPERIITNDDLILLPGELLVLTGDETALGSIPGASGIFEMSNFPRFNIASNDEIRLFSDNNVLIDSLQYLPSSWGGYEVALERKSPEVPSWIQINWAESISKYGGTPGWPNSVKPPESPPEPLNIDYSNSEAIIITFSRMLDEDSIHKPDHIKLYADQDRKTGPFESDSPTPTGKGIEISFAPVLSGPETVSIIPSESLEHGYLYTIELVGIQDIFGNSIKKQEWSFIYYDVLEASKNDVIINEVLYRPDQFHNRRFVEILNNSESVFDLRNWRIGRSTGNAVLLVDHDTSEPVYLTPGQKVVISEPGLVLAEQQITNNVLHIEQQAFPPLSRLGDSVYLLSGQDKTIDSLSYSPVWGGNRDGVSIERINPGGATLDPSNWKEHPENHSAGYRNFNFEDEPDPVMLLHAAQKNDQKIELHFSRFVYGESLQQVSLEDQIISLSKTESNAPYDSRFIFRSDHKIERRYKRIHIAAVTDYAGSISTNLGAPLAFLPEPGDVIINEVMYQPIAERYSNRPDQSEYVEVYNRSGIPLKVDHLVLHDRPDKNGHIRTLKPAPLKLTSLLPQSYAVFYADTSNTLQGARIYQSFSITDQMAENFFNINRLTLGLSTQGDELYLSYGEIILDSLWYHPSWHNPNLSDVRGISLERINQDIHTQNRTNWTSSSSPDGGTPGYRNSAAIPAAESIHNGLKLSPNPFSPNGDGHNDHLIIHYQLDHPDYLMHVRIFDRHGRLVRTLANGHQAGLSGKLIWDGRAENGLMNRAGLYIVHFEAFNSNKNNRKIYRTVAVLAVPL